MAPTTSRFIVWTLSLLAAVLLIFVLIPRMFNTPVAAHPIITANGATVGAAAGTGPDFAAQEAAAAAAQERAVAAQMLNIHYADSMARDEIPQDYPRKKIGACPYAKAPSGALPIRDIPMCLAVTSENMYLPGDAGASGALLGAHSGAADACGARPRPASA